MDDWCRRSIGLQGCPVDVDSMYQLVRSAGAHGVLTGSIQRLGLGYVFSVSLRPSGSVPVQISVSETATDSTDLVGAVRRLAENLSEQLAEAMPSLEAANAEERTLFTLRSLEAYRVYLDAMRSWGTDYITAVAGLRQAVRLDSTFAMARRRLAVGLFNLGIRRAEQVRESEAAYLLKDQLKPWERGNVAAYYFLRLGERGRALEEYRRVLDDFPRDLADFPAGDIALNNSGTIYSQQRDFELAERLFRSVTDTTMQSFGFYSQNWIPALVNGGLLDTADSLLDMARAAGADTSSYFQRSTRFRLIAERRYFEMRALDARTSLGRAATETDRFYRVGRDQYTALALGTLNRRMRLAKQLDHL